MTTRAPRRAWLPDAGRASTTRLVAMSALWLAWQAQWQTIPPVILPAQVAGILGGNTPHAAAAAGLIVAAGAAVALLISPIAGALSDRTRAPRGRRRPFLVVGVLASCAALVLLGLAASGGSLLAYSLAYLHLQFWWNWAAGPYAGLIPDVVPARQQSAAVGWLNALGTLGMILGNLLTVAFFRPPGHAGQVIGLFITLSLLSLPATLTGARERSSTGAVPQGTSRAFLRSFRISPRQYPAFYLVLVTRLLTNMGSWSILAFLLYYLQSVLGLPREDAMRLLPTLLGAGACLAIPSSLLGARLADRYGLVRVVQASNWVMAAAAVGYVLIAFHPAVVLLVPAMLVFSAANGVYSTADWSLALRVLPSGQDAGKDFGIWHVCMVLPQIVGPATTGLLIASVEEVASARLAYGLVFGIGAMWFVLGAIFVGRVREPEQASAA
jgi:Na+/melibiose symporter-like transporter